jgi:hypothetical protein
VSYVSHTRDAATGQVTEVVVTADLEPAGKKPPKGVLNWVAQPQPGVEPLHFEVRSVCVFSDRNAFPRVPCLVAVAGGEGGERLKFAEHCMRASGVFALREASLSQAVHRCKLSHTAAHSVTASHQRACDLNADP